MIPRTVMYSVGVALCLAAVTSCSETSSSDAEPNGADGRSADEGENSADPVEGADENNDVAPADSSGAGEASASNDGNVHQDTAFSTDLWAGAEADKDSSIDSEAEAVAPDTETGEADAGADAGSDDPPPPPYYGTNPFTLTAADPFSTFAADVDTASYDRFRQYVNAGMLPDRESVRLEELVNYFSYEYPAPEEGDLHPFRISLAAATSFLERESTLLRVGIQAAPAKAFEKKPTNLVFLIDVSGSMSGADKLPLVQRTLTATLNMLEPEDSVAVVTYASDTGVRLASTKVAERDTISAVITGLDAGGSTAGGAGIDLAYQQAEAAFIEGGINHIVLCTDGDFNVGPYTTPELVALIEEKRRSGITLTVLGYGMGSNDEMMEEISNAGNGIYGIISSEEQADRYVEDRMLSTLQHVAKDMKIQVELNPEIVTAYRLLGYENRAIADVDFRNDKVDAGEVGAGHRVTALYEVILAGGTVPEVEGAPPVVSGERVEGAAEIAAEDMVLVKVRYKNVGATEEDPAFETSSSLPPSAIVASLKNADPDLQWAAAVATFAEILKESPYVTPSALPDIDAIVNQQWLDTYRAEFNELFQKAVPLITAP